MEMSDECLELGMDKEILIRKTDILAISVIYISSMVFTD